MKKKRIGVYPNDLTKEERHKLEDGLELIAGELGAIIEINYQDNHLVFDCSPDPGEVSH